MTFIVDDKTLEKPDRLAAPLEFTRRHEARLMQWNIMPGAVRAIAIDCAPIWASVTSIVAC